MNYNVGDKVVCMNFDGASGLYLSHDKVYTIAKILWDSTEEPLILLTEMGDHAFNLSRFIKHKSIKYNIIWNNL